jgi:hypothetical protein
MNRETDDCTIPQIEFELHTAEHGMTASKLRSCATCSARESESSPPGFARGGANAM